jgi:hypothetical protein
VGQTLPLLTALYAHVSGIHTEQAYHSLRLTAKIFGFATQYVVQRHVTPFRVVFVVVFVLFEVRSATS